MTPSRHHDAPLDRRLSVAPMMDWTDRHDRYFLRLISSRALLYTEMVTTGAIVHGDRDRFLAFDPAERPLALQLGGSDPQDLAFAARLAGERGFDEVNLNVGCPSDRVQSGRFGACLLAEPELVAACVAAMRAATDLPVTVKTRIGIDRQDDAPFLHGFVETVAAAGCLTFIIHARKAWLDGLSPKENREVPPLRYDIVHQLKRKFPELDIVVNGGIREPAAARTHLQHVDGVMIGREAYQNPYSLTDFERALFGGAAAVPSRIDIAMRMLPYVERQRSRHVPLHSITRHMLGLFNGQPGARAWRRHVSENARHAGAGPEVIEKALDLVRPRLAA